MTGPNGRRLTPRQEAKRRALLEARAKCLDCAEAAKQAVLTGNWSFGAAICGRHQS